MSHYIKTNFNAEFFHAEETFKQFIKRIDNYNLSKLEKEELFKKYDIDKIQAWFNSKKENQTIAENEYNEALLKIERINNFFDAVESYIIENFNLEVDNYNKKVRDIVSYHLKKNQNILNNILDKIEDELLKNYVIAIYNENPHLSENMLIEEAKKRVQESQKYKQQQIIKNIEKN